MVVSDLFGSKLLSEAYGLSIFGRAPGNLSGPPFSGMLIYLFSPVALLNIPNTMFRNATVSRPASLTSLKK